MRAICLLLAVGIFNVVCGEQQKQAISVLYSSDKDTFDVKSEYDISYDAYGYYTRDLNASNWNFLDAYMQEEVDSVADHLLYSRAVGFLEGYATCPEIQLFYGNFYSAVFGTGKVGAQTIGFLKANYDWLNQMANNNAATDDYWYTISSVLKQLNGVYEGYVVGCGGNGKLTRADASTDFSTLTNPTLEHFLLINAWGDLYQIAMKFREPGEAARLMGNRRYSGVEKRKLIERCSAIVKMLPDQSDIIFGHATWDTYESLGPRILKHYSIPLMRKGYAEHHYDIYFSSSPALLSSIDDFFTISGYAQLGVMETTNSLYNLKLLDQVVPQTVLSWTRAVTSHQMASSGADWAVQFTRYHSGTYTNQWMVVDFKLFTPGNPASEGLLTVFEEVPGLTHTADMTARLLQDDYWASYNIPYFDDIAKASGYAEFCEKDFTFCYETAPRATLFKEHQHQVHDLATGDWILSYNDFQHDKVSLNDSCNTIACRGDLEPSDVNRGAYGALDTKVSSIMNAKRFPGNTPVIQARNGPTHAQQAVFCWSQLGVEEKNYVHNGQPDCFDFAPVLFP